MSRFELKFPGRALRTFFKQLCWATRERKQVAHTCAEALDRLSCA